MVGRFNRGIEIIILLIVSIVIFLMLVNHSYIYRANRIRDMMETERMNQIDPNMQNSIEIKIIGN